MPARHSDSTTTNGQVRHANSQRLVRAQDFERQRVFPPIVIVDEVTVRFVQRDRNTVVAAAERQTLNLKLARESSPAFHRRHGRRQMMRIGAKDVVAEAVTDKESHRDGRQV